MAGTNLFADFLPNVQVALTDDIGRAYLIRCTSAPPATANKFIRGCMAIRTDGSSGTAVYKNDGTYASPTWTLIDAIAADEIALAQGLMLIGNAGGTAEALDISAGGNIAVGNDTTMVALDLSGGGNIGVGNDTTIVALDASGANKILIGNGTTITSETVSGDLTNAGGVFTAAAALKADVMTVGLMGTVAAFGFPFNVTVDTAQTAALAKIEDGGAFANLADSAGEGGYTGAFQVWPDTEVENDACYFGGATPFGVITIDVSATAATYGADSVEWEYWDGGSWSSLTIVYDETDTNNQSGTRPFMQDGQIIFSAPSDWAPTTVDSQSAFWVRARIKAGFNVTQIPLLVDEHKLVTSPTATEMPANGAINRSRISWVTASASNNDTNVILCNLGNGQCSAITTLTQALRAHEVADWNITCATGDQIVMYVTQEDGTTEFADGIMEMRVVKD